jgi:lysozyme family protein
MGLDEALDYLLEEEGGWSNHKDDRGGATMYGVTQATYDGYRRAKSLPKRSVRQIEHSEARELYDTMYWRAASCHLLPWPISYLTFDAAVNSGPSRAVRWTQAGLGVSPDGKIGTKTLEAARATLEAGDGARLYAIVDARVQFLSALVKSKPTQLAFLLGWWRRTLRVLGRALTSEAGS